LTINPDPNINILPDIQLANRIVIISAVHQLLELRIRYNW